MPDGILPVWLWAAGYVVVALLIAVLWRGGGATAEPRRFALLGVFSAMMIVVMNVEILPFHFNLSVMTGIVLGPQFAVPAALIVNLILALMGHGGLTVAGLNSLVLSTEMVVGYSVFRLLARAGRPTALTAFAATVVGLAAGTAASFGIIAAGTPWVNRTLQTARMSPRQQGEVAEALRGAASGGHLDLARLALLMLGLGLIGWLLEGVLSSAVLVYLKKAFPDLFGGERKAPDTSADAGPAGA
jgi:cobalt/nickel transport system permease protein